MWALSLGWNFFCSSPQFFNIEVIEVHVSFSFVYFHHSVLHFDVHHSVLHFDVLKECFFAIKFKNYFLELATWSGNYSGTVGRLRYYSSIVLLFGNQHIDYSLFSFCDSVFKVIPLKLWSTIKLFLKHSWYEH